MQHWTLSSPNVTLNIWTEVSGTLEWAGLPLKFNCSFNCTQKQHDSVNRYYHQLEFMIKTNAKFKVLPYFCDVVHEWEKCRQTILRWYCKNNGSECRLGLEMFVSFYLSWFPVDGMHHMAMDEWMLLKEMRFNNLLQKKWGKKHNPLSSGVMKQRHIFKAVQHNT